MFEYQGGHAFSLSGFRFPFYRFSKLLLAVSVFFGFVSGLLLAVRTEPNSLSWMRTAMPCGMSIVWLFAVLFLPFFVAAFSVFLSVPVLMLPLCFVRFFCAAFTMGIVTLAYGNAGWLVRLLLFFSSSLSLPPLVWFCARHLDNTRQGAIQVDVLIYTVWILLIGTIDYRIVSPFLVMLID